jgi:thiol:disulfide interchange protein DsbC
MKKLLTSFMLLLALLQAGEVPLKSFEKLEMFSDGKLTLKRVYDHGSIYQVHFSTMTPQGKQNYSAFMTKDKKILIAGEAVNLSTREPLEMPKPALNMKLIRKEADIIYGTGKTELIVVTDPECYYCQAFQSRWEQLKKQYTLYVYLYPLGHHKEATQMSYHVLSQKGHAKKADALIQIAKDAKVERQGKSVKHKAYESSTFTKKEVKKFENKLSQNQSLGEVLGVRGTPAVFDTKGKFIIWNQLTPR